MDEDLTLGRGGGWCNTTLPNSFPLHSIDVVCNGGCSIYRGRGFLMRTKTGTQPSFIHHRKLSFTAELEREL